MKIKKCNHVFALNCENFVYCKKCNKFIKHLIDELIENNNKDELRKVIILSDRGSRKNLRALWKEIIENEG